MDVGDVLPDVDRLTCSFVSRGCQLSHHSNAQCGPLCLRCDANPCSQSLGGLFWHLVIFRSHSVAKDKARRQNKRHLFDILIHPNMVLEYLAIVAGAAIFLFVGRVCQ